jgi:hypothetical protein
MTCIVSFTDNGKVYMGGDRRLSYNAQTKLPTDSLHPKIIQTPSYIIGFSGNKGIQDLFDLISPLLDSWAEDQDFDTVVQGLCNILYLYKGNNSAIIFSDGKRASAIDTEGGLMHDYKAPSANLLVIGVGLELVRGCFHSTSKILPKDKITEAIEVVSKYYPDTVGGTTDIFP